MNPGPTEEAGKTARTFLEVMRDQPLALILGLSNVALLGFLYYQGVVAANARTQEMQLLYQNRTEVGQLLSTCVPAQQSELTRQQFEANRRELDDVKVMLQNRQRQIEELRQALANRTPLQSDLSREQINRQNGEIEDLKKKLDDLTKALQKESAPP